MFGKDKTIRPPAVSGMFYDGNAAELKRTVNALLSNARVPEQTAPENIRAVIVPHAGYMYSGQTAAYAYKAIQAKKYDAVIVVGPSHRKYFRGISVFPGDAYRTPLGDVAIQKELRDEMVDESAGIELSEIGHVDEHSIEVQLPFLQLLYGSFEFVPVIMGDQGRDYVVKLARKLENVLKNKNVLLVASTDLSHYYPQEAAIAMDKRVVQTVEGYDPDELMDQLEQKSVEACGGGPMVSVMKVSKLLGCNKASVLNYCTSGDVSGDMSAVVGYLAASIS